MIILLCVCVRERDTITLYILHTHNVICQWDLNKPGEKVVTMNSLTHKEGKMGMGKITFLESHTG